jgi:Sec7-like guanine-nucleotide exchange factor
MNCFDFLNLDIDEAFRKVCLKLEFVGETQVVDRILFQVAKRYWDCNPQTHEAFKSIGKFPFFLKKILFNFFYPFTC